MLLSNIGATEGLKDCLLDYVRLKNNDYVIMVPRVRKNMKCILLNSPMLELWNWLVCSAICKILCTVGKGRLNERNES